MAGFHGILQVAKYFSKRTTFRESVLDELTLTTHRRWSRRDKQAIGNIRNHQEDLEKNNIELLKMKTVEIKRKMKNPSGVKKQ